MNSCQRISQIRGKEGKIKMHGQQESPTLYVASGVNFGNDRSLASLACDLMSLA